MCFKRTVTLAPTKKKISFRKRSFLSVAEFVKEKRNAQGKRTKRMQRKIAIAELLKRTNATDHLIRSFVQLRTVKQ